MFSLQQLLGQEQGNAAIEQISRNVGADQSQVTSAVEAALPMLVNGLAGNAATPQGAESLNNALEKDHDGGILDNIRDAISGPQQSAPSPATNGGGILDNIFGGGRDQAAETVSTQSGIGSGQASQILTMLAPIVMAYLGRQKREQGIGAGGLGGLLGGLLGGSQSRSTGNPMMDMANKYLDKGGDGSAIDDIAGMAGGYFKK